MIKVLHIISDTNVGGAGRVLLNYLRCYDRTRFQVSVAMPRGSQLKERVEALDVPVHEVDAMADRSLDLPAISLLKKLIRQLDPRIVHTHGSLSGRIAARQCGRLVVYTRHSAFPLSEKAKRPPRRWVTKWLNERYADQIIAISPAALENLTDMGVDEGLITMMMNGVEPVPRAGEAACAALRAAWGIEEDDFTLGILARVEEYKGHMDVLEAVRLLRAEGRKIKLIVAGDGSFLPQVKARAAGLGLEDCVVFAGFVSDVAGALSVFDLQINASTAEASSLSILEGFSMGLPTVASDFGGNPCQVEHGVNGLIFPARDSARLAACVRELMDSPDTLARMRQGAEQSYRRRFTGEIMAANIEAVYEKALQGRKKT